MKYIIYFIGCVIIAMICHSIVKDIVSYYSLVSSISALWFAFIIGLNL
jgi:hypothetical protein